MIVDGKVFVDGVKNCGFIVNEVENIILFYKDILIVFFLKKLVYGCNMVLRFDVVN